MKKLFIVLTVAGTFNVAMAESEKACPNLDGIFLEDDYGYRISQKSCDEISFDGEFVYSHDDYAIKQTNGVEHVCHHEEGHATKFCKASWDNKTLRISVRHDFENPESIDIETSLDVVRCDDLQPNCTYGDRSPNDVIQITTPEFGTAEIPRWKTPQR